MSISHYGTLRDYRFEGKDADDIRGSDLYGRDDEKLGEIDDVIFDHGTGSVRYVVVDTGGWLSSKKFIVPADRLTPSTEHEDDYQVSLSKDEVQNFPAYDEDAVNDRDRWGDYEKRYEQSWTTDGGVLHQKDAPDRIITPPDQEVTTGSSGVRGSSTGSTSQSDLIRERQSSQRINEPIAGATVARTTGSSSNDQLRSDVGSSQNQSRLGQRWNRFEDRLRTDRSRITHTCGVCGTGPSSVTRDVDRDRKVG